MIDQVSQEMTATKRLPEDFKMARRNYFSPTCAIIKPTASELGDCYGVEKNRIGVTVLVLPSA